MVSPRFLQEFDCIAQSPDLHSGVVECPPPRHREVRAASVSSTNRVCASRYPHAYARSRTPSISRSVSSRYWRRNRSENASIPRMLWIRSHILQRTAPGEAATTRSKRWNVSPIMVYFMLYRSNFLDNGVDRPIDESRDLNCLRSILQGGYNGVRELRFTSSVG